MAGADEEMAHAVQAIQTQTYTDETCSLIYDVVLRTGGKSIIMDIIDRMKNAGRDDYEALTALQQSLQNLADIDPVTGPILMVHLSEPAADLYFHDIYDWINIVMWEMHSDELTKRLREIISQEKDPEVKESYSRWL